MDDSNSLQSEPVKILGVKVWGTARVVTDDAELLTKLQPEGYDAKAEQAILITVQAWDPNCRQHIPQRIDASQVARALADRDARIAALESEVARLRDQARSRA